MKRMAPTILRFEPNIPDSAELRRHLRHAGKLLAASSADRSARIATLRHAHSLITAALCGVDQALYQIDPSAPRPPVTDRARRTELVNPDSTEARRALRQAGKLLVAAAVDRGARGPFLRRARVWIGAALLKVDQSLYQLDPPEHPEAITDRDTAAHDLSDLGLRTLEWSRGSRR